MAANRFAFPVVVPPSGLTTLTFVNTSGSSQAAAPSPMFGISIAKGDIASGGWPKFETAGGANIPYSANLDTASRNASDGSTIHLGGVVLQLPASTAGSGTTVITVKSGGSAPSASSRTLSEITSGTNLTLDLVGIDNLSGTWTAGLNDAISAATEIIVYCDGPAGKTWRIRADFKQSGSPHGQLVAYWYITALSTGAGALAGFRFIVRVVPPFFDVASPTPQPYGYTAALKNSGSTSGLTQPVAFSAKAYTITNGNDYAGLYQIVTCTAHGYESGTPLRLSVVPTGGGLSTSTTVYVAPLNANEFVLAATAQEALTGPFVLGSGITSTVSGTATPHIETVMYASFFTANADGTWQYIQGGGSQAADTTLRTTFDTTYLRSTKTIPPYDFTVTPTSNSSYSYCPMTAGPVTRNIGQTGERDDIGPQPAWTARFIYTQAAVDERAIRVAGLAFAGCATGLRRSTTGNVPVANNGPDNVGGTYTGLGTTNPTLEWNGLNLISGITTPTGDLQGAWAIDRTDHWPSCYVPAYLLFGSPEFMDLVIENADYVVYSRWTAVRNFTVTPTDYYGCTFRSDGGPRGDAWPIRDLGMAIALLPDTIPDGSAVKDYLSDCLTAGLAMTLAYNTAQNSFWNTNGVYYFNTINGGGLPWQWSYLLAAMAFVYGATEIANVLTLLNFFIKFPNAVDADIGIYYWTAYVNRMRATNDGSGNGQPSTAIITNMNQMYFETVPGAGDFTISNTATGLCAYSAGDSQLVFTNNDQFLAFGSAQANLADDTAYFMVNVTDAGPGLAKTFQLAATMGGTPITFTGGSGGPIATISMYRPQNLPSGSHACGVGFFGADAYTANARMSFRICAANGATGISTIRGKMDTYWDNEVALTGITFVANPKYAYQASY